MRRHAIWAMGLVAVLGWQVSQAADPPARRGGPGSPPPGVKVLRDLVYVPGGHERNKLDLYLPEKAAEHPLPLIVWIHGGGWQGGNKDGCPAAWFVGKGYAAASINYRFSQHALFPAQIYDCKAAIRWLRANAKKYNLDPDHVGVWGASAGGHLVALLDVTGGVKELEGDEGNLDQSSRVQAVVDWFGPTDFATVGPGLSDKNSPVTKLIGGPPQDNKEQAAKASPITYVGKDAAPILIMHGDKDKLVLPSQSDEFAAALKKVGADVTLQIVKGNGHGGPDFLNPENRKRIADFFDKHLREKK